MGGAKRRVKNLFEKVREDINAVLSTMETEWISDIDAVGEEIEAATKNEDAGKVKRQKISNTCGIYDSLLEVLKTYEQVCQRDERLKILEEGTDLPNLNSAELKMAITQVLKDLKLSRDSFIGQQTYVPSILEVLYNAASNNDIKVFKETIENDKLPPNASKFILNYSFPKENWPPGAGAQSDKIPHLAAAKSNYDILDYLVDQNFNLDALDRSGKIVVEHLLSANLGESTRADKVLVKLFEYEETRKRFPPNSYSHFAVSCNWLNLVRDFIEKYEVTINSNNGRSGFTCLHEAVNGRHIEMFDLLMKYSPNLTAVDDNRKTVLHLACRVNFHQAVLALMDKESKLPGWIENGFRAPFSICLAADSLESFQVLSKYYDVNKKLATFLEVARSRNSKKILTWLQSLNPPQPTEA